jgi:hypothetical protein
VGNSSLNIIFTPPADTDAPNVTITGPSSTSMSVINLAGTASDNQSVSEVTWVNNRGGSGVAEGTTNWSVTGISLMEGENIITVSARDPSGNVGNATLNIVLTASGEPPQSQCSENIALDKAVEDGGVIYDGMPGTKAIDGIKNTSRNYWAGISSPNWMLIDLQDIYTIDKIIARPYGWNDPRYYYDDEWEIKYSLDKNSWNDFTNVTKVRGNGSLSGSGIQIIKGNPGEGNYEDYKEYEFTFNPTDVRYIRFYVSKGDIDNDSNLEEIEIYTFCEAQPDNGVSPVRAPVGLKLIQR